MSIDSLGPTALVLAAAFMHACWNAIVKAGADRLLLMAALKVPTMGIGVLLLAILEPPNWESLPYALAASLAFASYVYFLLRGYALGDLGFVYPIARGSAPLAVAMLSALLLGERLGPLELASLLAVCGGLLLIARAGAAGSSRAALLPALGVGLSIATYTLLDGVGGRLSGNALAYSAFGNLATGVMLLAYVHWARPGELLSFLRREWKMSTAGGALMFASYAAVVYAMTLAPLARVAALRESSVVFATLIGTFLLKESCGGRRIAGSAVVAAGIIGLALAGRG